MAHLDDQEAAVVEPEVVETGPDNGDVETEQADGLSFYEKKPDDSEEEEDELLDEREEEEEEGEKEPEQPAIPVPVSLKTEMKEQFAQLPHEAQRIVSDIVTQRDREYHQGLETARAKVLQSAHAEVAHARAEIQREFAEQQTEFLKLLIPEAPPSSLARSNPEEYQWRRAEYEESVQAIGGLMERFHGIRNEAATHLTQQEQAEEQAQLQERLGGLLTIPELANPETGPAALQEVQVYAVERLGYAPEAFALIDKQDFNAIKLAMEDRKAALANAEDAEKWRTHQRKRNERPRQAQSGRFAAAPVGSRASSGQAVDTEEAALRRHYPSSFK